MCNEAFLASYPQASGIFLPYLVDHSPSILVIPNGVKRKKRAFRFINHLTGKLEFLNTVTQVVSKLKILKKDLNKLNRANGTVFTKLKGLRDKLKQCQVAVDSDPHNVVLMNNATNTLLGYEAAKHDELVLLQQKVKIQWLIEGDKNTKFFHSVLKSRIKKSMVDNICDENGSRFSGDQLRLLMRKKDAMFDIVDNKASGPDGYSSLFFKKACNIVGPDVCVAVKEFFKTENY
ncbi:uncharacterized protein [Rutidosis leptorrhynchoides]|uniref:uncharacterized protein n=1 Tax=Rutidosis leptorrhynchoides TaxID=125765 RepID=UPI003A999302